VAPEYILENWTDEQFESFWQARNSRILETDRAIQRASQPDRTPHFSPPPSRRVSDMELFSMMGINTGKA